MNIYELVKAACKEKGVSVMRLEEQLGFARGSIYKWNENRPSIDRVALVAHALGKPVDYFVEEVKA